MKAGGFPGRFLVPCSKSGAVTHPLPAPTPAPTQLAPVVLVVVIIIALCSPLISPRQTDGRTERGHGRNLGPWLGHVVFEERRFLHGTLVARQTRKTKEKRGSRLKSALPGGGVALQRLQRAQPGAGLPSVDTRQGAASTAAR